MINKLSRIALILSLVPAAIGFAADNGYTSNPVKVFLTVKTNDQRLAPAGDLKFVKLAQPPEQQESIFVDPTKTFQTLVGIGGALTDAAAETFYKLPKAAQAEFLKAYFDPHDGIGYSLGRTHINSCDFSSDMYTYVTDGDKSLASFDISHDLKYRIPFIKEVMATAGAEHFTLFASPWSPPAWMKDNTNMLHGGKLKPEFDAAWAQYYAKFIKAYAHEGVPIWGLTVQNEPMAVQKWESCVYTAEEERNFVRDFLGPELERAGLAGKKLMIWDHNRGMLYQRAKVVLDDPRAAKYVWGVAYHWYVGDHFENVKAVQEAYPQTHLFFSEGCNSPFDQSVFNDWAWGETYGKSMINDFNNGAVAWTDWNVLLDEHGGPNHVQNFCFAPVHGNTQTGQLSYMNSYYYIGHFSKFIRPGAKRIISSSTTDNLITTAFLNPDKGVAVVVMNSSEDKQPFNLWLDGRVAKATSPAHSIMTLTLSK